MDRMENTTTGTVVNAVGRVSRFVRGASAILVAACLTAFAVLVVARGDGGAGSRIGRGLAFGAVGAVFAVIGVNLMRSAVSGSASDVKWQTYNGIQAVKQM